MEISQIPANIYTEATPNPQTMKFVANQMLFPKNSADFPTAESAEGISPLASEMFEKFDFIRGVFIMNNFVTLTKTPETEWFEVIPALRTYIANYMNEGNAIVFEDILRQKLEKGEIKASSNAITADDDEMVQKIKELLNKYVQPAVEQDGGSIVFRSYRNGVVSLGMQGACSGCPSSTYTLKAGIENLLKRMIPEIQSVEAEMM